MRYLLIALVLAAWSGCKEKVEASAAPVAPKAATVVPQPSAEMEKRLTELEKKVTELTKRKPRAPVPDLIGLEKRVYALEDDKPGVGYCKIDRNWQGWISQPKVRGNGPKDDPRNCDASVCRIHVETGSYGKCRKIMKIRPFRSTGPGHKDFEPITVTLRAESTLGKHGALKCEFHLIVPAPCNSIDQLKLR